jgi:hypothetical protein
MSQIILAPIKFTNLLDHAPFHADHRLHLQEKSCIFSCGMCGLDMRQTIENKAKYRIRGMGGWWAFFAARLPGPWGPLHCGFGTPPDGETKRTRRVIRGIYDYSRFSELLDQNLSPDLDQVSRALARKFRWQIQPSGATALNFLGLSTQVPARAVYLLAGPDRAYQVGNTALVFEHTALKESGVKLKESGLIVQALKSLGREQITPEVILKIRTWLPESLRGKVLADTKTATGWVYSAIQQITQQELHG